MNLPFLYPEHPEFKLHVEYVAQELKLFYLEHDVSRPHDFENEAQARAKDIVLHVGSRPVKFVWLRDLVDTLRGRPSNEMFDRGLEKYLREAIERAEAENDRWIASGAYDLQADATAGFKTILLRKLGIDSAQQGRNGGK